MGLFPKVIEFLDCFLIQLCICDGAFSSYCEAHGGRSLAKGEEQPPPIVLISRCFVSFNYIIPHLCVKVIEGNISSGVHAH